MEPVGDFISWVSLLTICDTFDSGPVDCSWAASLFESAVVAGRLELAELVARGAAQRSAVAVGAAVQRDHHGVDPLQVVGHVAECHLQRVAERTHAADEAVRVAHLAERRAAAELVLDGLKSLDEAADAGRQLGDLVAESVEAVGQLVGARSESVEVARSGR